MPEVESFPLSVELLRRLFMELEVGVLLLCLGVVVPFLVAGLVAIAGLVVVGFVPTGALTPALAVGPTPSFRYNSSTFLCISSTAYFRTMISASLSFCCCSSSIIIYS